MHEIVTAREALGRDLKQRDPRWGVRDVVDIVRVAELREIVDMPANNVSLVLVKSSRRS